MMSVRIHFFSTFCSGFGLKKIPDRKKKMEFTISGVSQAGGEV